MTTSLSRKRTGFAANADRQDLTPQTQRNGVVQVNLRDLGFRQQLSETARKKIERNDARANLVITTAARFAFR